MRKTLLLAFLAVTCCAQDLQPLEQQLQGIWVGKTLKFVQPFSGKKIDFDASGHYAGKEPPKCDGIQSLDVTSVELRPDMLIVRGKDDPQRGAFGPPGQASRSKLSDREIQVSNNGTPWTLDGIQKAMRVIQAGGIDPIPYPEGWTAPPPGSNRQIVYMLPDGPVYRAGNGVTPPRGIHTPDPEYSEPARQAKACAAVSLSAIVAEDGHLTHIRVAKPGVGLGLEEKAIDAVRTWQMEPARLNGQPVRSEVNISTYFSLY
jgi:TonB family protein